MFSFSLKTVTDYVEVYDIENNNKHFTGSVCYCLLLWLHGKYNRLKYSDNVSVYEWYPTVTNQRYRAVLFVFPCVHEWNIWKYFLTFNFDALDSEEEKKFRS